MKKGEEQSRGVFAGGRGLKMEVKVYIEVKNDDE